MKGKQLTRQGKKLQKLPDGAPRRLSDGRNAWRMMSNAQRVEFVKFMVEHEGGNLGTTEGNDHELESKAAGIRVWFGWKNLDIRKLGSLFL